VEKQKVGRVRQVLSALRRWPSAADHGKGYGKGGPNKSSQRTLLAAAHAAYAQFLPFECLPGTSCD